MQTKLFSIIKECAEIKKDIDSAEFNTCLAKIQFLLGVKYGDLAGIKFHSVAWERLSFDEKVILLKEYIIEEIKEEFKLTL